MHPVIPHFASECMNEIHNGGELSWPLVNRKFLNENTHKIVIQLNGKKRGLMTCDINFDENKLINLIKSDEQYKKYFKEKTIIKTIYVKGRLINLILK